MKQYSEKAAAAVISAMLKQAQAKDFRENLKYTWTDEAGRQCAADGVLLFRLEKPIAGLPEMPDGLTPINLKPIFDSVKTLRELPTPKAADVAALIAYDRQHKKVYKRYLYMFGEGMPAVNILMLRDVLKVYPDAQFYAGECLGPVIVKSEHGDGIIMPVRVMDGNRERREIIYNLSAFADRFAV